MTDIEYEKGKRHGREGKDQHHYEKFIHRCKCKDPIIEITEKEETTIAVILIVGSLTIVSVLAFLTVLIVGV